MGAANHDDHQFALLNVLDNTGSHAVPRLEDPWARSLLLQLQDFTGARAALLLGKATGTRQILNSCSSM